MLQTSAIDTSMAYEIKLKVKREERNKHGKRNIDCETHLQISEIKFEKILAGILLVYIFQNTSCLMKYHRQ